MWAYFVTDRFLLYELAVSLSFIFRSACNCEIWFKGANMTMSIFFVQSTGDSQRIAERIYVLRRKKKPVYRETLSSYTTNRFLLWTDGSVNQVKPISSLLLRQSDCRVIGGLWLELFLTRSVHGGWCTPGLSHSDDTPTPDGSADGWGFGLPALLWVGAASPWARACALPCESVD